ncbi:MAG: DUF4386 family protein [Firmicutes bacterium]|nr:DUF4386 family protein [Bacillota bacterium]
MGNSTDLNKSGLYRAGGVSALVLGISYIIITVLYVIGGALPGGVEEWLRHLAGHTDEWWSILGLSVLTDVLFLPVGWSIYTALKELDKNAAFAGVSFLVLFVVLDMAVTWPNYAALIDLGRKYAAAVDDSQRLALVAAATEVLSSKLFGIYTILMPSLGILIIGTVMLKGIFGKAAGFLGIVTGIIGIVSAVGPFFVSFLGMAVVITSVLTLTWLLLVGCKLIQLSRRKIYS